MKLNYKHSFGYLQLRQATEDHADFLFELFKEVKTEELDAGHWPSKLRDQVLLQQFHAHQQHHCDTLSYVICLAEIPIGRLILQNTDQALLIADIALLQYFRSQGIGTALLRHLQSEAAAAQKPLLLNVIHGSLAVRLYQRLGFACISKTDTHEQMQWPSH